MQREVLPVLGSRPFAEVRKRDLIALVEAVMDRGVPIMANRVLAHIKRLFSWAAGRDLIETDPAAHIERAGPGGDARPGADRPRTGRGLARGRGARPARSAPACAC